MKTSEQSKIIPQLNPLGDSKLHIYRVTTEFTYDEDTNTTKIKMRKFRYISVKPTYSTTNPIKFYLVITLYRRPGYVYRTNYDNDIQRIHSTAELKSTIFNIYKSTYHTSCRAASLEPKKFTIKEFSDKCFMDLYLREMSELMTPVRDKFRNIFND